MSTARRSVRGRLLASASLAGILVLGTSCSGSPSAVPASTGISTSTGPVPTGPGGTGSTASSTLPARTIDSALTTALSAEHQAKATYDNVVLVLGDRGPFANVSSGENQHIATLESLARNYSVTLPAGPFTGQASPSSLTAACQLGVTIEQEIIAMYGRLLPEVTSSASLTQAFENLRSNSESDHLPAFRHCAG